ncbi:hypothetical protein JYU03_00015 [bacterium AH-315-F03]|nr:hypothetical protein [bacterium AH-315-F03]
MQVITTRDKCNYSEVEKAIAEVVQSRMLAQLEARRITLKRSSESPLLGRVLIISASYKPMLNPRAFRWSTIAERWSENQTLVDVISSWAPDSERKTILSGVRLFRVGGGVIELIRAKLRPASPNTTRPSENKNNTNRTSILRSLLSRLLHKAHDVIWKNIYWPDYACLWYFSALKQAERLLSQRRYDTLITVSDPFTAHVVGLKLKKKYPELKWLVDIGDPFSFRRDNPTNNFGLYEKKNLRLERQIFHGANSIAVTSEATQKRYKELFPEYSLKIDVIGPLAPDVQNSNTDVSPFENNGKHKLVFAGALYRLIRNPHYLLKLYECLLNKPGQSSFELHFFGGYDDCASYFSQYESGLGKTLFLHGLVSRETTMSALRNATALINIGNNNPYQLPSKIMEYAAFGKPIVQLSSIGNDSSGEFLSTYPNVLFLDSSDSSDSIKVEEQASKIECLLNETKRNISKSTLKDILQPYSSESVSNQYAEIIRRSIKVTK